MKTENENGSCMFWIITERQMPGGTGYTQRFQEKAERVEDGRRA